MNEFLSRNKMSLKEKKMQRNKKLKFRKQNAKIRIHKNYLSTRYL